MSRFAWLDSLLRHNGTKAWTSVGHMIEAENPTARAKASGEEISVSTLSLRCAQAWPLRNALLFLGRLSDFCLKGCSGSSGYSA